MDLDLIELAKKEFGCTSRLNQAGYILPDGSLLNFGNDGYRTEDHREIMTIYTDNDIKIWSDEYRYNYVIDFMNHGPIRMDNRNGSLNMSVEPTSKQYFIIKQIVKYNDGDVYIDFSDKQGNLIHSVCYDNASVSRVINDIKRFYNEGIKPSGDVIERKLSPHKQVLYETIMNQLSKLVLNKFKEIDAYNRNKQKRTAGN